MDGVQNVLRAIRSHLGMDVAFVSEFMGDRRFFRHVDSGAGRSPIRAGDSLSMSEGYCRQVVEGQLPELIPDTAAVPAAMAIPATRQLPIGSHLSVPLRLADGHVYGTFCCFSYQPDASLSERDLGMMRVFADLLAQQIDADRENVRRRREKTDRITAALRAGEPGMVFQPVFRLSDGALLGAESLARFKAEPLRSPDRWFLEAGEVGFRRDLELQAMRNALADFRSAWKRGPFYLGLNSSPQTLVEGRLDEVFSGFPAERIIIEVTEHAHIENYDEVLRALAPLRAKGIRVAVDDAGSGYASMRHILNLSPEIIKLDVSLTRGIDADRKRRALAKALIEFGRQTDCEILAEGVETAAELQALRSLGVHAAQGFHLARPAPIADYCSRLSPLATCGAAPKARKSKA